MKIFASDLDGTLIFNGKVKDCDREAIKKFKAAGNLFGACTGRSKLMVKGNVDDVDMDFYIVSSGAIILDKNYDVIYESTISSTTAKSIYEHYDCILLFHTDDYVYINKPWVELPSLKLLNDFSDIEDIKIYSISMIVDTNETAQSINEELKRDYDDIIGYQNGPSIDIVAANNSKGLGLLRLKKENDEIYAIGDSFNDIPMLEVAHSFTFDYAPDSVKEVADEIVESVAMAIEKII